MKTSRATKYINENKHTVNPEYRLHYHGMPEMGWMNDPNGLVFYKGKYHVFYQHYPYDSVWGPMHWGHMISDDLITFEYMPVALAPDQPDESGCFSGGAFVDEQDTLHLLYTKHLDQDGDITQTQAIASSTDGIHFTKLSHPIITTDMINGHALKSDVRDPSMFMEDGVYYVILGAKDNLDNGKFLIYQTTNLEDFTYHDSWTNRSLFGFMGECPDITKLDGKHLFIYSKIDTDPILGENINTSNYIIGDFDFANRKYQFHVSGQMDSGHHFYAPQTLQAPDGRIIVIGWMDMWGEKNVTHDLGHNWFGATSFPRELRIKDNTLFQTPIKELLQYRIDPTTLLESQVVQKQLDLEIAETSQDFTIKFVNPLDFNESFNITYEDGYVSIDGTSLHLNPLPQKQSRQQYDSVSLRILVDTSSFEIFVNNGIETFTSRVYMTGNTYQLEVSEAIKGILYTIRTKENAL